MENLYTLHRTFARGKVARVGNLEMYYEDYGNGDPLVLLHGFGGSGQNQDPFVSELSHRYRLVVVDLRGHGHSTNPDGTFTHRQAANDVFQLLDSLGIQRFRAMGMSSGGMTLLHMATSRPGRIDSMVLISASTHFPDPARVILRRVSWATMPPEVRAMYEHCAARGEEQIQQLVAQFNAFHHDDDDMNFTAEDLSAITARTLVVHGDRDPFFPVEIPVAIFRALGDAELWILPGGGHVPIYDPSVGFTAAALRFLERPRATGFPSA